MQPSQTVPEPDLDGRLPRQQLQPPPNEKLHLRASPDAGKASPGSPGTVFPQPDLHLTRSLISELQAEQNVRSPEGRAEEGLPEAEFREFFAVSLEVRLIPPHSPSPPSPPLTPQTRHVDHTARFPPVVVLLQLQPHGTRHSHIVRNTRHPGSSQALVEREEAARGSRRSPVARARLSNRWAVPVRTRKDDQFLCISNFEYT